MIELQFLNALFSKIPDNLPPSITLYRVVVHSQVVPIYFDFTQEIFVAAGPVETITDWYVHSSEIFATKSFIFNSTETPQFNKKMVGKEFCSLDKSYLIKLPRPVRDNWHYRDHVAFVLKAQDLHAYR